MYIAIRPILTVALAAALLTPLVGDETPDKAAPVLETKETHIATYEKTDYGRRVISPDGKHIAYVIKRDNKYVVVLDGVESKTAYDQIYWEDLVFSPDSARFAYRASVKINPEKANDGKGVREIEEMNNRRGFCIIDGVEQKRYAEVGKVVFSPDSRHYAYSAAEGKWEMRGTGEMPWPVLIGSYFVVRDGIEGKKCGKIENLAFSPDSKHLAHLAYHGFFIDDLRVAAANDMQLGPTVFSPDSKRWACYVRPEGRWMMTVDGVTYDKYDLPGGAIFSPDSRRFAYAGRQGDKTIVILDGAEGKKYDSVDKFVFSPDSKHFAYVAMNEGKYFVVFDGKEGPKSDDRVWSLTFSPDSKRFAYMIRKEKKESIILDGVEGPKYENIIIESLAFSPDSAHFAYVAMQENNKYFLVLDGVEMSKRNSVIPQSFAFSPDSKHYACVAWSEKGVVLVVDGAESQPYSGGLYRYCEEYRDMRVVFTAPDKCHTIMYKTTDGKKFDIVLVEATAPKSGK